MIFVRVFGKQKWQAGASSCAGSVSMSDTAPTMIARFRLAFVSQVFRFEIVNPPA
jgi:hypothetical protein